MYRETIRIGKLVFPPSSSSAKCHVCPVCSRNVLPQSIHKHLEKHDRSAERARLREMGVGSFTKPLVGQLGFLGTADVLPKPAKAKPRKKASAA